MSIDELIVAITSHDMGDGYFDAANLVSKLLPIKYHAQLKQLFNGPVWDGDVISKSYRDALLSYGLAIRVCVKSEQGYTGLTYFGGTVTKALEKET